MGIRARPDAHIGFADNTPHPSEFRFTITVGGSASCRIEYSGTPPHA